MNGGDDDGEDVEDGDGGDGKRCNIMRMRMRKGGIRKMQMRINLI